MTEQNVSYTYELNGDGSVRITGYTGDAVLLTVPAELDGHKVADIGMFAFHGCAELRHVVLSEGIVTVYVNAFYDCPALESVRLPDSIENSVNSSVRACPNFKGFQVSDHHPQFTSKNGVLFNTELGQLCDYPAGLTDAGYTVPEGTRQIAMGAFAEHPHLCSVILPEGLTRIGDAAFRDCACLREVTLPGTLTHMGAQAFAGCGALERLQLPASLTEIGQNALSSCWSLGDIGPEGQGEGFAVRDGVLYDRPMTALLRFPVDGRVGFAVPEGVERIAAGAFSGCGDLSEIRLPQSLRVIEGSAFSHCSMLGDITLPEGVEAVAPATFLGCTNLAQVTLPDSLREVGSRAFWYCFSLTELEVPTAAVVAEDAFGGDADVLREIGLPCDTRLRRR